MATAYGSITVSKLTDIEDIYFEYSLAVSDANVTNNYPFNQVGELGWTINGESRKTPPAWQNGYKIWVREVKIKTDIATKIYGNPYPDTAINQTSTDLITLQSKIKKIWSNSTGSYMASGIGNNEIDTEVVSTYGFNSKTTTGGISFNYNAIPLTEFGVNGLKLYIPTIANNIVTNSNLGVELTTSALKFYDPTHHKAVMILTGSDLTFNKPNTTTAAAVLNNSGLILSSGGIEAGSKNTTDYIYLYSNDDATNHTLTINGHEASDWRVVAGNKFGVNKAGNLYASNVDISGKITSTEGKIGPWFINNNSISRNANGNAAGSYNTASNIYFGTSGLSLGTAFRVDSSGNLTATGATLTTATIGDGTNKITIGKSSNNSNYSALYSNSHSSLASTVNGFYLGTDGLSIGSNFTVTNTGDITAANVDISGIIKATSGYIGSNATNKITIGNNSTNASIYSGSHSSLDSTNSGFYIGTDGLSIGSKFKYVGGTTETLVVDNITATNLTINSGSIGSNITIGGKAQSDYLNSNVQVGGRNLFLGTRDYDNYNLFVHSGDPITIIPSEPTDILNFPNVTAGSTNIYQAAICRERIPYLLIRDKPIIFSCYIKVANGVTTGWFPQLELYEAKEGGSRIGVTNRNETIVGTGEWVKITQERTVGDTTWNLSSTPADFSTCYVRLSFWKLYTEGYAAGFQVKEFKYEIGNKATDWTPAPEDVQAEIDAKKSVHTLNALWTDGTQYTETYANLLSYATEGRTGLGCRVASIDGINVGDTVRLAFKASDMGSSGTIVYIIGTVDSTSVGSYPSLFWTSHGLDTTVIDGGHILTGTLDASKVNVTNLSASNISGGTLRIESVPSGALNSNVEVGGRNLLLNSANMPFVSSGIGGYRASGGTASHIAITSPPISGISGGIRVTNNGTSATRIGLAQDRRYNTFVAGEKYSQSFWIRASTSFTSTVDCQPIWISSSQTTGAISKSMTLTTSWQYVKGEGATLSGTQGDYYSAGYVYASNVPAGGYIEICADKVEKGTKATDWTPSPEDTVNDNYLLDTQKMSQWILGSRVTRNTSNEFGELTFTGSTADWGCNAAAEPLIKPSILDGTPLWLSFEYTATASANAFYANLHGSATTEGGQSTTRTKYVNNVITLPAASSWTKVSTLLPSTVAELTLGSGDVNGLFVQLYLHNDNVTVKLRKVKLEHGVAATNWSPASEDFKTYITRIDDAGIFISPANQSPTSTDAGNSVKINASGMEVYRNGVSVASYGDYSRVGQIADGRGNTRTTQTGMDLYVNTTRVGGLNQKTNYIDPDNITRTNALFINAAQYFAVVNEANSTTRPVIESSGSHLQLRSNNATVAFVGNSEEAFFGLDSGNTNSADDAYMAFTNGVGTTIDVGVVNDWGGSGDEEFGIWTESTPTERWLIGGTPDGHVMCEGIYLNTSSSGSNVRTIQTISGQADYQLRRYVSSSRRYKEDIADLTDSELDADRLYDLRAVQFRYKDDYLESTDPRYGKLVSGFIAEEVEEAYPIAVQYEDEMPEDWEPRFIIPPMLKLIQDQKKKIDELEERLEALERR